MFRYRKRREKGVETDPLKSSFMNFPHLYISQALFNGSFYGAKAIFVLYITEQLSLPLDESIALFSLFMTLCYGTSLVGGYIADKGLGVKNAILLGGILSALGFLGILSSNKEICFFGLALASLGSGYFKPNLLTAAGLVFEYPKDPRKEKVCSLVYVAMNLGGFVAPIACGFMAKTWGWSYGMLLVVAIFAGATYSVHKTLWFHPAHANPRGASLSKGKLILVNSSLIFFLYLLFTYKSYFHRLMGIITIVSLVWLANIYYHCKPRERKAVLAVIGYIFLFSLFSALFEQVGTSMVLFFEKSLDRHILGITIPASAFLSLDPLFILLFGTPLMALSAKYLGKTRPFDGIAKASSGFFFAALSFGILALGAYYHKATLISPLWVIAAVFAQIIGELCIAPLSFAKISEHAPPRYQSILMSFWPMAIAYGHYFAGLIAPYSLQKGQWPFSGVSNQHQAFFISIALWALCVSLSLMLYQQFRYGIKRQKENNSKIKFLGLDF